MHPHLQTPATGSYNPANVVCSPVSGVMEISSWVDEAKFTSIMGVFCHKSDQWPQQILDLVRSAISDCWGSHLEEGETFPCCGASGHYRKVLDALQKEAEERVKWLNGELNYIDFDDNDDLDGLWELITDFRL